MSETIQAPKYKVGQEVLKPDGKVGKVLDVQFINGVWKYEVTSRSVDVRKQEVVDGTMIVEESEIKDVPGGQSEGDED